MLYDFLLQNQDEILAMAESKTIELAGIRPSSDQLRKGLPIFYSQLLVVFKLEQEHLEPFAKNEEAVTEAAGLHGAELLRLGYTLSHVVHAYGAMCQSITQLATNKDFPITALEFRDLNRCLDIAIAGAVTEFQSLRNTEIDNREVEHLGFLAHELRNALSTVNISLQLIKRGTVGFSGNTGHLLEKGIKRIEELVDRSLTEVRFRVDPKLHTEEVHLLQLVDQLMVTSEVQARQKNQTIDIQVDPQVVVHADQPLFYSALSNLIQNALKYSHEGGKIQIRGHSEKGNTIVEVEDECGGLSPEKAKDLFKPFEQQSENRSGLGLGLTIAKRAMFLNQGKIDILNLPGKGCIFKITLPDHPAA